MRTAASPTGQGRLSGGTIGQRSTVALRPIRHAYECRRSPHARRLELRLLPVHSCSSPPAILVLWAAIACSAGMVAGICFVRPRPLAAVLLAARIYSSYKKMARAVNLAPEDLNFSSRRHPPFQPLLQPAAIPQSNSAPSPHPLPAPE